MNLHALLQKRHAARQPVRAALIGAGKFGSMFLAQVPHTPGLEVPVIADLDPTRAKRRLPHSRLVSAALRNEPTGQPLGFRGDVVAVAKRNLRAGEMLDGEGGYTVWGKLIPAAESLKVGALPIGLAHGVTLTKDIAHGSVVTCSDAAFDPQNETVATRAMEKRFLASPPGVRRS